MVATAERVRARLSELGFDAVRFASLGPVTPDGLSPWLASGHHADMDWMERTRDKRLDPALVLPGARSAILLGINYNARQRASGPVWARYSLYRDYHDSVKRSLVLAGKALEEVCAIPGDAYRYYVDTGPILERQWAARSGMGFIGKNAMLISRDFGNWLFLAAILTTVDFPPDEPIALRQRPQGVGLLCGSCRRCLDACPTQAFASEGVVDARRCISYHTIENRGIIPREFRRAIGDRIYGCDTCLEVCPWNRFAKEGRALILEAASSGMRLSLREILELDPERFAWAFRGTAVKRLKLTGLLRNACVVAGNSADPALLAPLLALVRHPQAIVRAHAVWAVRRLGGEAELAGPRGAESDPVVLQEYEASVL
jgi:epoxyqueuosine reductase